MACAGSHILSGNVFEPRALDELLPEWREDEDCPIRAPATCSRFRLLTRSLAIPLPNPPQMKNKGNYVISLRWGWEGGWVRASTEIAPGARHHGAHI